MCKELKITHDDSYMVYKMDLNNMTIELMEDRSDELLSVIFLKRDYNNLISWLSSRFGGERNINTIFDIIKRNNGKSVKDRIMLYVKDM